MSVDYGGWTLGVAAVVGTASLLLGWRRPFLVMALLLLLLPLRDFGTRWMNVHTGLSVDQVTALGRWWFVLILALLGLAGARWVVRSWQERSLPRPALTDLLLGLALGLAVLATLLSPNRSAAVLSLRGYLQPLGAFLLARLIAPSRAELRWLLIGWLVIGVIMAGMGLWQATSWSEADYRSEGYMRQDGSLVVPYTRVLGQRYLRPSSTVSGPNELGLDMVLLFLVAALWSITARTAARPPLIGLSLLFTVGVAISLSRSAFLGFVVALVAGLSLHRAALVDLWRAATRRRRVALVLGGAAALGSIALILASSGTLFAVLRTVRTVARQYHVLDSVQAMLYLSQHPQGVGMGLVEPKGALALIEAGGLYHVEGSIFQIAMEMGVWGLAAWLAFWGAALVRIWRNWHGLRTPELRIVAGTAFAGWLGSLVAFLFLPLMQSISLMVWLWFLLGAGYESASWASAWRSAEASARLAQVPEPQPVPG
jgi:hypothetical protein